MKKVLLVWREACERISVHGGKGLDDDDGTVARTGRTIKPFTSKSEAIRRSRWCKVISLSIEDSTSRRSHERKLPKSVIPAIVFP